jgi:hypothetical protein
MPSRRSVEPPEEAMTVARRYLRRERPLSVLVAVLVASVFVGTFLLTSLLPALAAGAVLVAVVRVPVLRPSGTVRLRTDADVGTVVDSFAGPTPPVLPFHWGIADRITADGDTATYRVSYLLGLRSVDVTVRSRTDTTPTGDRRVALEVTVDDQPRSTYTATVSRRNDRTVVEYEYTANRRFALRRLPQRIVADRYRDEALAVQGYTVVERDEQYGL